MLGFTEPTICTTESNGMPIALAYSGKVIHALQKHANAVRTTIPTSNETMTAFLVLCFFYTQTKLVIQIVQHLKDLRVHQHKPYSFLL